MSGTFSDGLRTNALPSVIAIGNIHIGTMAGKLNGVMPATTPSGSRRDLAVHAAAHLERAAVVQVLQAEASSTSCLGAGTRSVSPGSGC